MKFTEFMYIVRQEYPLYWHVVLAVCPTHYHYYGCNWCLPGVPLLPLKRAPDVINKKTVAKGLKYIRCIEGDIRKTSISEWLAARRRYPKEWLKCALPNHSRWKVTPIRKMYEEKLRSLRSLPLPIAGEIGAYLLP